MKENKSSEKMKHFAKKKWDNFTDWFTDKEHPHSRLNKNVFFHDALKLIGLILVFLIIYSNLDKINQIVLIFIKLGSLLQLVLLFFILRKAWHLTINIKYAFRGLNHGTKAIIAIVIVLLLFMAFLNQDKVVNSITQTYEEANFSKLNPIQVSANFSLFGSDKNSSSGKIVPSTYEDPLITKCKASYNSCKDVSTQKYDLSISLIKTEKFENETKADEFIKTWSDPSMYYMNLLASMGLYQDSIEFPIVLFALKVNNVQGQMPLVIVCDKKGDLTKLSKTNLGCGV